MVDAPSRWRGLGTAPTEDLALTEEQHQTLDPIRRQDLFHERQKAKDKKTKNHPVCAPFKARGGACMQICGSKCPRRWGHATPLVSLWSGKKGA